MDVRDIIPWRRRRRRGRFSPSTSLFDDSFFPERFFDEFFERGFGESGRFDPSIDVAEKESGIEVTAELPGLEQEDIELTLDEHGLTLRGEKREERKEEDGDFYRSERTFGSFQRFIPLSSEI